MCTALELTTKDHYFGRNLDLELSYGERVVVTPRNFPITYREMPTQSSHYAIIGMATVADGYPLYYDGTNEKGLSMAGLNFPGNAMYFPHAEGKDNVTPFEFVPWILGQCATVAEARTLLDRINLVNINFSEQLPLSPLHWMISDATQTIVVESMADGLHVHDNPVGVMTNNPPFDYQLWNLNNYMSLTKEQPETRFADGFEADRYSRGMGSIGLPGGLDSASRFVKVAFTRMNSVCADDEMSSVAQFFHILGSVYQQTGLCKLGENSYEYTIYTSCVNTTKGIYYYRTYGNSQINAIDMHHEDLDGSALSEFPLADKESINWQN